VPSAYYALWLFGSAFAAAALGALLVQRYALTRHLLDVPNARSSHERPTPRGGGLAIVVSFLTGFTVLFWSGHVPVDLFIALLGGGLLVTAVSFWEDHRRLPVKLRITVHFLAASWALYWLGGMAPLDLGFATWSWGWFRQVLGIIGLVWLINLYNFMDGIDGMAAMEGIFVALAAMLLLGWQSDLSWSLGLLAASCAGFLVLNWAPAQIFMGDTGSCFLGFVFGVMAIATAAREALPIWCWVILLGVFLVDATATLLRRMLRGARWYEAHCSHGYQHAARRWRSHIKVMLGVLALNTLWLLPCAYLALSWRRWSFVIALLALAPLLVLALLFRAGREDATIK
jgi:Fuc2NAc and GlcNAc transferase